MRKWTIESAWTLLQLDSMTPMDWTKSKWIVYLISRVYCIIVYHIPSDVSIVKMSVYSHDVFYKWNGGVANNAKSRAMVSLLLPRRRTKAAPSWSQKCVCRSLQLEIPSCQLPSFSYMKLGGLGLCEWCNRRLNQLFRFVQCLGNGFRLMHEFLTKNFNFSLSSLLHGEKNVSHR